MNFPPYSIIYLVIGLIVRGLALINIMGVCMRILYVHGVYVQHSLTHVHVHCTGFNEIKLSGARMGCDDKLIIMPHLIIFYPLWSVTTPKGGALWCFNSIHDHGFMFSRVMMKCMFIS